MKTEITNATFPKFNNIIMMFILLVAFSGPYRSQNPDSEKGQVVTGIPCKGKVKYFSDQKISCCMLARDFEIDHHLIPAESEVKFNRDGTPSSCRLSRDTKFYGQLLPKETRVFFNHWAEPLSFWLAKDARIQGYLIGAMNDGPGIPLYANGKLKEFWLAQDSVIQGIPCTSSGNVFVYGWHVISMGTERRIKFHDNGMLQRAMLSQDLNIQGYVYKKGELIYLDREGKVDRITNGNADK